MASPTARVDPITSCRPFVRAKLETAEANLRRSYRPMHDDSRVIVDFPCDPVQQVSELELEFGEQQPGRLMLLRFTRPAEGGNFRLFGVEVRAPEQQQSYDYHAMERFTSKAVQRELAASALDLDHVRTPLVATLNEVYFSDHLPSMHGFSRTPIHRLIRMQGRNRHLVHGPEGLEQVLEFSPVSFERSYTGAARSTAQKEYLPLEVASVPLLAAVPETALYAATEDEHRDLVRARFSASYLAAPDWLRELFLVLAGRFGSSAMIHELVRAARQGPEPQRVLAVTALAKITGWDIRFDAQGTPRPATAVAADYARECAVGGL